MAAEQEINFERVRELFFPYASKKLAELKKVRTRLVHYTSADVAVSILRNREVWMRNSTTMSDFMEVEHGFQCLNHAYRGEPGALFKKVLDSIFPGSVKELEERFNAWLPGIRSDTYLTCVSEHLDTEDSHGRLSMWRAYGGKTGVALVLNAAPFYAETNALKAYSSAVAYWDSSNFSREFLAIANGMQLAPDLLRNLGKERVFSLAFTMFRFAVLCTKHPGFHEEREWRVVYSPTMEASEMIAPSIEVVGGTPQRVYKIPLRNAPEAGLRGMEIPEILDRIIIGPTQYPGAIYQAFFTLLQDAGVSNPENRIVMSDIPLR